MQRRTLIDLMQLTWPERIIGGLAILGLVLMGMLLGTLSLGLLVLAWAGLAVRRWWRGRGARAVPRQGPAVVEGEFRVLERHLATEQGPARG